MHIVSSLKDCCVSHQNTSDARETSAADWFLFGSRQFSTPGDTIEYKIYILNVCNSADDLKRDEENEYLNIRYILKSFKDVKSNP